MAERRGLLEVTILIPFTQNDLGNGLYRMNVSHLENGLNGIYRAVQVNGNDIENGTNLNGDDVTAWNTPLHRPVRVLELRDENDVVIYDARKDDPR